MQPLTINEEPFRQLAIEALPKQNTDEDLIRWVAAGEPAYLGTLFERHHLSLYQFCLQLTRNKTMSQDLVQEVFIKVLNKAKSYRGDGSFKAWVFNTAQ